MLMVGRGNLEMLKDSSSHEYTTSKTTRLDHHNKPISIMQISTGTIQLSVGRSI